jgi:ketosteroid isomerase-like protein
MSSEDSKRAALRYFEAVNDNGNEEAILASLHPDFIFRCMACAPAALQVQCNREQIAKVPKAMSAGLKRPFHWTVVRIIAEGEQVALETLGDCEKLNGERYDNRYHFAIEVKDGLVIELREYSCTYSSARAWLDSKEVAATGVVNPTA